MLANIKKTPSESWSEKDAAIITSLPAKRPPHALAPLPPHWRQQPEDPEKWQGECNTRKGARSWNCEYERLSSIVVVVVVEMY